MCLTQIKHAQININLSSFWTVHAGWQRIQKILVLVMLMPHMENGQGQNHPCFFVTFLYCQNHREKLIL
jgi:hypothetical protein